VFVDIDELSCNTVNSYPEDILDMYYAHETVHTLAYYDFVVAKIEKQIPQRPLRILDFGCGAGMFMRRARARGHDTYGVDFSPYAEAARERFNLNILSKDLADCELDPESFDVIISHATFEHLLAPLELTRMLVQYLKPDGLFIVSGVPNFSSISVKWFRNFYRNGLGHVNHYEPHSLKKLFDLAGLRTTYVSGYGVSIWWLLDKIRGLKVREGSSWPVLTREALPHNDLIDSYDTLKPSMSARILTWAYTSLPPLRLSLSLEAWGRKTTN
jgi:SAM-dependent methyltransferase